MNSSAAEEVRNTVREHYGKVAETNGAVGCAPGCCGATPTASAALGYSSDELASAPDGANLGLGCGNPQAIAGLRVGETVLDLGSGGGFDCFLAARKVGPTGRVIGVDMTPQMVTKARANARAAGIVNVDFRLGEIEHLPVLDASVDVILSNCVINLSPSKEEVIKEAFRVLRPGGRLAISDVVATAPIPERFLGTEAALTGCAGGAAHVSDLERMLTEAGFDAIAVRPRLESRAFIKDWMPGSGVEEYIASATIEATKPATTRACCGPECCTPGASQ
ncbi:MAG TPA: arsenite methyltransferase [Polyangiaceae bacterium]|nr:arsenite methyltransferase [Polyangiaceae bacterium]